MDALREAAQIGEAGREADHVDAVFSARVERDDRFGGEAVNGRDRLEVDAVLAAVMDRNAPMRVRA